MTEILWWAFIGAAWAWWGLILLKFLAARFVAFTGHITHKCPNCSVATFTQEDLYVHWLKKHCSMRDEMNPRKL